MGRSKARWIAAAAALAAFVAIVVTCSPDPTPGDAASPPTERTDVSGGPGGGRTEPRPRRARAADRTDVRGSAPEGADGAGAAGSSGEPGTTAPGGSSAEGAGGSGSRTDGAPGAGDAPPRPPRPAAGRVRGRVVDAATGAPVAGARVLLTGHTDATGIPSGTYGTVTSPDGSFDVGPNAGDPPWTADRFELVAVAPSRRTERMAAEDGAVLRLEADLAPEPWGAVAGTVTRPDGTPVPGFRRIDAMNTLGDYHGFFVRVAADGAFRIDGVAAGPWRFLWNGAAGRVREVVQVAPRGEARITLTVGEAFGPDDVREVGAESVRDVSVAGIPAAGDAVLRFRRTGTRQTWTAVVADGRAAVEGLPAIAWTLELDRAGAAPEVRALPVPQGDGPLAVNWPDLR